ncbi:MAG: hypothetical protein NTY76_05970 [Candidatus Omnitrophica bacterium]|nr:hypothetical protein [Candidatus Omnitrophota bacterium]
MIGVGSTLNCSNKTITISGNWTNNGTFTPGTGTVKFTGAGQSNISGDTTFNNLYCDIAGKTLQFTAGSTQTITGTLTLKGTSIINRLILQSSASPTQWKIDPQGTVAVDFLEVHDSNNVGPAIYNANSVFFNCIGWATNPPPPSPTLTNTTTITTQLSTLENPRYPSPDMGQMTTYQINIVNPSVGGVYFYQPLTSYDMAAFNAMILDANSYSFLNGSINLVGHEGLRSLFENSGNQGLSR